MNHTPAGSWTVSGSKEAMEVPKNFKDLRKLGVRNIAQYSAANGPFPAFFSIYLSTLTSSILSAMFTGACGPPEKLSLALVPRSAHDCETRFLNSIVPHAETHWQEGWNFVIKKLVIPTTEHLWLINHRRSWCNWLPLCVSLVSISQHISYEKRTQIERIERVADCWSNTQLTDCEIRTERREDELKCITATLRHYRYWPLI